MMYFSEKIIGHKIENCEFIFSYTYIYIYISFVLQKDKYKTFIWSTIYDFFFYVE